MGIEEFVESLEKEQSNQSNKRAESDKIQGYQTLLQILQKQDYNKDSIKNSLDTDRAKTLGLLFWATKNGKIELKNDLGRKIWRNVLDYAEKNMSKEDFFQIKAGLYVIEKGNKFIFVNSLAEGVGMLLMGMSAGIISWYWVANKIREKFVNSYFKREVFLGQYQK